MQKHPTKERTIYDIRRDNLIILIKKLGKQKILADIMDWDSSRISGIKSGFRDLKEEIAREIEKNVSKTMPEIHERWLDIDRSDLNNKSIKANNVIELKDHTAVVFPLIDILSSSGENIITMYNTGEKNVSLPSSIVERLGLNTSTCCALEVDGEHMQPIYNPNDPVIISMIDKEVESGEVYAVKLDGHVNIYRLFKEFNDAIKVSADNPNTKLKYPDKLIEKFEAEKRLEIIGKVVTHIRVVQKK
jgi:SOS-response transcriptional repressor LexA